MSLRDKIKNMPALKSAALKILFRRKPYSARVRWYVAMFTIWPLYLRRGVSWGARLDLVPFNRFRLGRFSRIEKNVVINNGMGDVIIGDEVHTGIGCVIIGPVTLHKHVGLSQYVRILGMHHGIDPDIPHHFQPSTKAPVILEEDAFIGTGTVIMGKKDGSPLRIGKYARVGANSVVMHDIPPYTIAVGNPARVVKTWDFHRSEWISVKVQSSVSQPGLTVQQEA